jgi:type IV pilus assembly protein PilB
MTIARLIDMGMEPFLVASGLECVVAQRLARKLCDCQRAVTVDPEHLAENGFDLDGDAFEAFEPGRCVRCGQTGFRGRTGLYELMAVSDEMRRLIVERPSAEDIAELAVSQGMRRLREDGLEKVREGVTSVAEVLRVLGG